MQKDKVTKMSVGLGPLLITIINAPMPSEFNVEAILWSYCSDWICEGEYIYIYIGVLLAYLFFRSN